MLNTVDFATPACQPVYPFRYWCLPDKKPEKPVPDKETENPSVPDDKPADSGFGDNSLSLEHLDIPLSPTDIKADVDVDITLDITNNIIYYQSTPMPAEVPAEIDAA